MVTDVHPRRLARRLALAAVMVVPLWTGCVELPRDAKMQLAEAEKAYRGNDVRGAESTLNALLAKYPNHAESGEAYYLRALCATRGSNKSQASADINRCLIVSSDEELIARANAMAGMLALESGRYPQATTHFAKALGKLPEKPPTDLVRFRHGIALQRAGLWGQARDQFTAIIQRYSGSSVAGHARRMNEWTHSYFAIQCGAFRDGDGARKNVEKLKRAGLSAWTGMRPRSGEMLHTVFVGQYANYAAAAARLGDVRRKAPGAFIIP